jgi:hypothetical protein
VFEPAPVPVAVRVVATGQVSENDTDAVLATWLGWACELRVGRATGRGGLIGTAAVVAAGGVGCCATGPMLSDRVGRALTVRVTRTERVGAGAVDDLAWLLLAAVALGTAAALGACASVSCCRPAAPIAPTATTAAAIDTNPPSRGQRRHRTPRGEGFSGGGAGRSEGRGGSGGRVRGLIVMIGHGSGW